MASCPSSFEKSLGVKLRLVGNGLLNTPSSVDELLALLDDAEDLLANVEQEPPDPLLDSLFPVMKALIADSLLKHSVEGVRVSVAYCLSEVLRISAPQEPFNDDQMKVIFELIVETFCKLSQPSTQYYEKALSILETVARVKACLLMLDLQCNALVVQMFQNLWAIIRSNPTDDVMWAVEQIMTDILGESEDISLGFLSPLLDSVLKENKNVAPLCWKLGERVIARCAAKLGPVLHGAVQSSGTTLDDYSPVVASICESEPTVVENNYANGSSQPMAAHGLVFSPGEVVPDLDSAPGSSTSDAAARLFPNNIGPVVKTTIDKADSTGSKGSTKLAIDLEVLPKKRERKPNKWMNPDEGYKLSWLCIDRKKSGRRRLLTNGHDLSAAPKISSRKRRILQKVNVEPDVGDSTVACNEEAPVPGDLAGKKPKLSTVGERGSGLPGRRLVGRKIKVWWPLDEMFYYGVVQCYDPFRKRHKVLYNDGDVDVVEFSYFGAPEPAPKEQLYTEIVDDLRGGDPCIGSGSQVASQETYGTLGAIVRSQTGSRQVGFLTNRHVAVDLDYPNQKMFHPLPPTLGPGVYLGAVERATSFITDELWYGIFAGINPETFVRADGAFIPFADDFTVSTVTTSVRGVGEIGDVKIIDLQAPIGSLIGRQVMKVGRSSGLTTGTVLAYALEYNDEKGICFLTDFLVVGENQQTFDLEGDSGSLVILKGEGSGKPRPIGIIWGGTANRGRLKLKVGQPPENWTSGVDLGRLLNLLELDLITTNEGLKVAVQEQRAASATAMGSTVGDSSPPDGIMGKDKIDEKLDSLGLQIEHIPLDVEPSSSEMNLSLMDPDFTIEDGIKAGPSIEHEFIPPSFCRRSPLHQNNPSNKMVSQNLSSLRNNCDEDVCVSLQLGDNETKRRRSDSSSDAGGLK